VTIDKAIEAYLREALRDFEKEEAKHHTWRRMSAGMSWPQRDSSASSLGGSKASVNDHIPAAVELRS
jgi:hypothetical protein